MEEASRDYETINVKTYTLSMPFRKGNQVSNWSKWVRLCTKTTGPKNRTTRTIHAAIATYFKIHLCVNDAEKKGQYTSWGSGAASVFHSVGFIPCLTCKTIAAPNRDLKETNAAGTSYILKETGNSKQED